LSSGDGTSATVAFKYMSGAGRQTYVSGRVIEFAQVLAVDASGSRTEWTAQRRVIAVRRRGDAMAFGKGEVEGV
jgi:hypothetical protein